MAEINRSNKNCDAAMNYGVMGKVTNNYENVTYMNLQ